MCPTDNTGGVEKPGPHREGIAYRDIDSQMVDFARKVKFNERILQRLQAYELMLLESATLTALLDILLYVTPSHFGLNGVSLTLYDPEGVIAGLIPEGSDFALEVGLERDNFDMQQLYGVRPEVEYIASDDPRALRAIANVDYGRTALMLPLVRDGLVVGSFHWVSGEPNAFCSGVEREFLNHLAAIIAICLQNCVNAERLARLSLLDPLTLLSNRRAFDMALRTELSRAHRSHRPLTLLLSEVDELESINQKFGYLSGDFTMRCIARRISGMLRGTDSIARVGRGRFALLLPCCVESRGQEIAERIRSETEFMEIDDGRDAHLFASLSIGLTGWTPQNYPAINMEQLAGQLNAVAEKALEKASAGGGNRVAVSRLAAMLV